MLESLVEWMGYPMYYAYQDAPPPPRAGASHSTIYPYGPFPAGDGGTVMLGLQNEREWRAFCDKVLRRPELADDERFSANFKRSANREELRALIVEAFAALPAAEVVARLEQAQIANAHVNDMAGVWAHPQLQARQRWTSIDSSGRAPAGVVAAGQQQRLRSAHGCGAGAGRRQRRAACRTGLYRGRYPAPARDRNGMRRRT